MQRALTNRGLSRRGISRSCIITAFAIAALLSGAALAQSQTGESLGDVARANRANQQSQEAAGTMPKVITNHDLPAGSQGIPEASASEPMTTVSGVNRHDLYRDQRLSNHLQAEQNTGAEWRARIQAQENRIADLQTRIDRVNAAMHSSYGTAQYDTPVNRSQAFQMERLAMMQEMLDQQKRRLALMQDAARHAGMEQ
jgi:hypothetical protein